MPLKNHIIILIFIFFGCQSILPAQENRDIPEKPQIKYRKISAISSYEAIDDWTDIPAVQYYGNGPDKDLRMDVTIWKDGRIAWKDRSRRESLAYFKAQLPEKEVDLLLEKMTSRYKSSPLERHHIKGNTASCRNFSFHLLSVGHADIHTSQVYSSELWDHPSLSTACSLYDQVEKESPREFLDSVKKRMNNWPVKAFLLNYQDRYDDQDRYGENRPKDDVFSDEEIYWYTRQFADDGAFFVYLGEIIREIIPKDENLTSEIVLKSRKYFTVKVRLEGNDRVFTYENVEKEKDEIDRMMDEIRKKMYDMEKGREDQ